MFSRKTCFAAILTLLICVPALADEKAFLQAVVFDALRSGDTELAKAGYSLDDPRQSSVEINVDGKHWYENAAGNSAVFGKDNLFFHYSTTLNKGGEKYILECLGYVSQVHWNMKLAITNPGKEISEMASSMGGAIAPESLGSDCSVQSYRWYWFNKRMDVPSGGEGKGQVHLDFNPTSYSTKLTANVNYASPGDKGEPPLEARSRSEFPDKGPLGENTRAASYSDSPTKAPLGAEAD